MIDPLPPILHPASFRITPSKPINPWCGQWAEGARYSRQQLATMERDRLDPRTIEAVRVKRRASSAETYWPTTMPAPVHEYDCPILQRRLDGRLKVLAPAGVTAIVLDDGWVAHPKKKSGSRRFPR